MVKLSTEDEKYIMMRKKKAKMLSMIFRIFRLFPVNKKKIVFSAYEGDGGFCCNPRYIAEELHKKHPDYRMIWLLHDTKKAFPTWITPVKDTTLNMVYQLSTSMVWIDNYRKPYGTLKRKGQLYIQTWHASIGFKAVGLFRGDSFPKIARIVSEWDSSLIDYVISNSKYCDEIYPQKLLYNGLTIRVGSPRVDPLINDVENLRKKLRESLKLNQEVKLLLYAPTFRGGTQQGIKKVETEIPDLDFDVVIKALEEKFGGQWRGLLRLHPQLAAKMDKMPLLKNDERLIDVSQMPDMSQILGGCDMLITDYSSCAFDAAFAKIPVLIYADDAKEYVEDRGKLMWKKEELPFSVAEDNDSLIRNISEYDSSEYSKSIECFMKKYSIVEDGEASVRVCNYVESFMKSGVLLG